MSEWQPARIRIVHCLNDARNVVLQNALVRVRPEPDPEIPTKTPKKCEGLMFEIHKDDIDRLIPWESDARILMCEHEILTD